MRRFLLVFAVLPLAAGALMFRAEDAPAAAVFNTNHDCTFCHGIHGGDPGQLLQNPVFEALCLSCHGPGGPSVLKADVHVNTGSTCSHCHDPHSNQPNWRGGINLKLVKDSVYDSQNDVTRPVTFESRGTDVGDPEFRSFCDESGEGGVWDRVCDTCHQGAAPSNHKYDDPTDHKHMTGNTCTSHHVHVQGFDRSP